MVDTKEHIVFLEASTTGSGEKSIQYARNTGRTTTLICKDFRNYPSAILDYADNIACIDTTDVQATIRLLGILNKLDPIHGILTTNDFFVVEAAMAAEHFGLKTTASENVRRAKNKYLMREALNEISPELNPEFTLALNLNEARNFAARVGYPFIAKPQDANDSCNVQIIKNEEGLYQYFSESEKREFNAVGQKFAEGVLLEQVIGGKEYCLDVLFPGDDAIILMGAFTKKIAGQETNNFIKIGASFPSSVDETKKLFDEILPALHGLGLKIGAANIDCKIVDGKVKILEINPRLVGDQMGSHMIELATGLNPAHAIVEFALGHDFNWKPNKDAAVAIHRITMPQAGFFLGIRNIKQMRADPNVAYVNELGLQGQWIEAARSNRDVVGSVIAVGNTPIDAMATATFWAEKAKVGNDTEATLVRKYSKAVGLGYMGLASQILDVLKESLYMPFALADAFGKATDAGSIERATEILSQTSRNSILQSEISTEKFEMLYKRVLTDEMLSLEERIRESIAPDTRLHSSLRRLEY